MIVIIHHKRIKLNRGKMSLIGDDIRSDKYLNQLILQAS